MPCVVNSVEEFLDMCQECFGCEPNLTWGHDYNGNEVYRDNEPNRHIVLVLESDFRAENPHVQLEEGK